jgi:hypothetical protein
VKREKTERQKLKETSKLKLTASSAHPHNASTDEEDLPPAPPTSMAERDGQQQLQDNSPNTSIHSGSEISQVSKSSLPVTPRGNLNEPVSLAGDKEVLQCGQLQKKKKFATSSSQYSSFFFVLRSDGYLYYYHVCFLPDCAMSH